MYKAAARAMIRRNIRLLNEGRYEPALAMFAPDAQLSFPGQNSWSRQHRAPRGGRAPDATHQGRDEIESFLRRYVDHGIQMEVEDILVNGPPWNMRAAVRVHDWIPGVSGDVYANRAVLMVRVVWGKIHSQEDYEDTERTSALDLGYSLMPVPIGGVNRPVAAQNDEFLPVDQSHPGRFAGQGKCEPAALVDQTHTT